MKWNETFATFHFTTCTPINLLVTFFFSVFWLLVNWASCPSVHAFISLFSYGDDSTCATVVDQIMSLSPHPPFPPHEQWHIHRETHSMMLCNNAVTASSPSNYSNRVTTVYNTPYGNGWMEERIKQLTHGVLLLMMMWHTSTHKLTVFFNIRSTALWK